MNRWMLRLAPLVMLASLLTGSPAQAQENSADVVKATATADKPDADGKQTVTITLSIAKPYHLYANPVGLKDLESTQTVITVSAATKPSKVDIAYPAGKLEKDDVVGDYKIYEDTVTVKATVVRAKGDTSPLTVEVKLQACNSQTCLLPGTIKVPVK
jgi:DsbC/DsbD-like thiol-disulfide interchange protein